MQSEKWCWLFYSILLLSHGKMFHFEEYSLYGKQGLSLINCNPIMGWESNPLFCWIQKNFSLLKNECDHIFARFNALLINKIHRSCISKENGALISHVMFTFHHAADVFPNVVKNGKLTSIKRTISYMSIEWVFILDSRGLILDPPIAMHEVSNIDGRYLNEEGRWSSTIVLILGPYGDYLASIDFDATSQWWSSSWWPARKIFSIIQNSQISFTDSLKID